MMRPEPAPVLTGKCAREFVKKVEAPPTQKNVEIFQEAERVYKAIRQIK
jgi:hypothetical protein